MARRLPPRPRSSVRTEDGKGIGVAVIIIVWLVVVDFFLGLGYGTYRLASP